MSEGKKVIENAKIRFKRAAKKVLHREGSPSEDETRTVPTFDASIFERKIQPPTGYVTPEGRVILAKEPHERTEDDLDIVEEEIQHVEFFRRIPYNLLRGLSRVLRFQEYSKDQLILREGHLPWAMYVIIAGVVTVYNEVLGSKTAFLFTRHFHSLTVFPCCGVSQMTRRSHKKKVEELSHGMQFGVDELLSGGRRESNVACKSPTQLLQLMKEDFDALLKSVFLRDRLLFEKSLQSLPTLAKFEWQEEDYTWLKKRVRLGKFPAHTIILGGTDDVPYYVHFIILGECAVEQEVEFIVEHNLGYIRLRPIPWAYEPDGEPRKVFKKRLEICQLVQGHYFGFGENTKRRFYRSLEQVETLMIPRHLLLEKHPKLFDKLKKQFEESFPPIQYILDKYLEVLNWEKFKAKVARQVTGGASKSKLDSRPPFVKYF